MFNIWIANIDIANEGRFDKVGKDISVKYETVNTMTSVTESINPTTREIKREEHFFKPVFCQSEQDGLRLVTAYIKDTKSFRGLDNDLLNLGLIGWGEIAIIAAEMHGKDYN
jgi:hypothetical protein